MSKEEVDSAQSIEIVDNTFGGSLPDFIAAFSRQRSISEQEKEDIKRIFGLLYMP